MAQPREVYLRTYQVGFGDCFLLSFHYARSQRHVLIDFGSMELPDAQRYRKGTPWLTRVAQDIESRCGGGLTAVIATHRHQDHISGFATKPDGQGPGDIIARCKPKRVIQPWTEHPQAEREALRAPTASSSHAFLAALADMHAVSARVTELVAHANATQSAFGNRRSTKVRQLAFLGRDNIKNLAAVENLMAMAPESSHAYVRHGDKTGLERLLPGVKVHVLGPPDLTQTQKIRKQTDADDREFWMLHHNFWRAASQTLAAAPRRRRGKRSPLPAELRWLAKKVDALHVDQTLAIVRALDEAMNNTSLILLFEIGKGAERKLLLFPGDAQLENWSYALRDAPGAATTRALLAEVDLYKVGHHGSRNATPKELLWAGFQKAAPHVAKEQRMHTVLSTLPGKHGHAARHTEVPRKTLVGELQRHTTLTSTETLRGKTQSAGLVPGQDYQDLRVV